jgi:hypothetical protein
MSHRRPVTVLTGAAALVLSIGCPGRGHGSGSSTSPSNPTGTGPSPPTFTADDGAGVGATTVQASADGLTFAPTPASFPPGVSRTITSLPDGRYRMYYYSDGTSFDVLSAVSVDGLNWTVEDGVRYSDPGSGPIRVTALPSGGYRLYYVTSCGIDRRQELDPRRQRAGRQPWRAPEPARLVHQRRDDADLLPGSALGRWQRRGERHHHVLIRRRPRSRRPCRWTATRAQSSRRQPCRRAGRRGERAAVARAVWPRATRPAGTE